MCTAMYASHARLKLGAKLLTPVELHPIRPAMAWPLSLMRTPAQSISRCTHFSVIGQFLSDVYPLLAAFAWAWREAAANNSGRTDLGPSELLKIPSRASKINARLSCIDPIRDLDTSASKTLARFGNFLRASCGFASRLTGGGSGMAEAAGPAPPPAVTSQLARSEEHTS